jgi:ATP-dependent helicase/nuclease subunit A
MAMSDLPETKKLIGETTARQMRAATPGLSAWVSANAGSGKTHVLSQRVVRLLMDGTAPSAILCLTYTKAAAAEMSLRIFKILSEWTSLDDVSLNAKLTELEGRPPSRDKLLHARRLFAAALETPGGLKIQTIHAFCEAILHRFPLEANVAGHFQVLDDDAAKQMLEDARRLIINSSANEKETDLARAVSNILSIAGEHGFDQLIGQFINARHALSSFLQRAETVGGVRIQLATELDISPDQTEDELIMNLWPLPSMSDEQIDLYYDLAHERKNKTPKDLAQSLKTARSERSPTLRYEILKSGFLTKAGKPRSMSKAVNADLLDAMPDLMQMLSDVAEHILNIEDLIKRRHCLDASEQALVIAKHFIEAFEGLKRRQAMLDYDDLIIQTANLFQKSGAGSWVHYKLDKGIDHILIDEAQDTSPSQWNVVQSLAREFYRGLSAREVERTIFAVGDEKQSIYSFQGAQPERFDYERRQTSRRAENSANDFDSIALRVSFRSTAEILDMVDLVFGDDSASKGLSFSGEAIIHETVRQNAPGRVELWEMLAKQKKDQSEDWLQPFDSVSETDPVNLLAQQISTTLEKWVGKEQIEDQKTGQLRPISAGDILILVRKRDAFVPTLIRTLKSQTDIPVAGTDRLRLTDHIAVQDLIALGRTLLLKDDDLSLASVLKSPFFNISEDQLFELCAKRDQNTSVWQNLCYLALSDDVWEKIKVKIEYVDALSQRLSVHDFYQHVLGPIGGRQIYLNRMGHEVSDVLDGFLDAALDHDMNALPGLQSFLAKLDQSKQEIKREQEQGVDAVRIMTVHASKGLEAPIVFLVDPGSSAFHTSHAATLRPISDDSDQQSLPKGFLWVPTGKLENSKSALLKDKQKELAEEEYRRLLYVGLTRAADRLIVCGYRGVREASSLTWHGLVSNGFERAQSETVKEIHNKFGQLEWKAKHYSRDIAERSIDTLPTIMNEKRSAIERPECLDILVKKSRSLPRPLIPSGAHAILDEEDITSPLNSPFHKSDSPSINALEYGKAIHRLLQVLPEMKPEDWETQSLGYLRNALPNLSAEAYSGIINNMIGLLNDVEFAPLFHGGGASEFSIMGNINVAGEERMVSGRIDRIAVLEDKVLIIDYKTNSNPPTELADVPTTYINQMAIYRAVLQPLYPDRSIRAALLFTRAPRLITVSDEYLEQALSRLSSN